MSQHRTPVFVPVLSRGKHRSPRKGACFMELASFLAGEPWSDHPACTHPLLAALARDVNDYVGDQARREIAPLVTEVIGLNDRSPFIDARLARKVALAALPIASAQRQRVTAVGLLCCEQALNALEGRPASYLSPVAEAALAQVPDARDWALDFRSDFGKVDKFSSRSAPSIVHSAVVGIAVAAVSDAEERLVNLLRSSIADCAAWMGRGTTSVTDDQWHQICELTTPGSRVKVRR